MPQLWEAVRPKLDGTTIRFLVPKFHLPAHVVACHSPFSFNFAPGVAHTDGEGIEWDWSVINPVSYSVWEMKPGHHEDTLNDHWGDLNWHKIVGIGKIISHIHSYRKQN